MYRLILGPDLPGRQRGKRVIRVANHNAPYVATLTFDHVTAINRHRVPVVIVFKSGRGWAQPTKIFVWNTVDGWNTAEQFRRVGYSRVVWKVLGTILRG